MTATASAPGKLMLFGEHAVVYGHPCIVTAVDQRVVVTVERNGRDLLQLEAPDLGLMAYSKTLADLGGKDVPKSVAFIEMLYKRFLQRYPQRQGIVVRTKSDFSSSFGFGSSSAVTVAFAKALTSLYEIELSNKELFNLCYQAVLDVQGVGSGFDLAAAIWGGTLYYEPPAKVVEQIDIDGLFFIVGYTGVKADTATIVRMVAEIRRKDPKKIEQILSQIEAVTLDARSAIERRDWKLLGKLMQDNQLLLQQLEVSTDCLNHLNTGTIQAGAWGAKLSGAGGGDCMIAIATQARRLFVEDAIRRAGGEVLRVKIGAEGVRLESTSTQTTVLDQQVATA